MAERLGALGVELEAGLNCERSKEPRVVSSPSSAILVLVVLTDEERAIAEAAAVITTSSTAPPGPFTRSITAPPEQRMGRLGT